MGDANRLRPKKEGKIRFCVDYRRLNAIGVGDAYSVSRMKEYIDSLGDAKVFLTLDDNFSYWKIDIGVADRAKTALRPITVYTGLSECFYV